MFFGAVIAPGTECLPDAAEGAILHISQACLFNPTSNEKTYLQVCDGEKTYALCALQKDKQENVSLDLFVSTGSDISFRTTGGKNEVHLVGYFEPESDSESDDFDSSFDESDEELDHDEEEEDDGEGISAKKGSQDEGESDGTSDDEDDNDSDSDKEMASAKDSDEDTDVDDDDDDDDEESVKEAPKTPLKPQKKSSGKLPEKSKSITSVVAGEGKKRKAEMSAAKPSKVHKAESSGKSTESEFEKQLQDYLKKNGRCMISQLAGKVRKPDSLKAVKYQAFLKSKPSFVVEGQFVSLKN